MPCAKSAAEQHRLNGRYTVPYAIGNILLTLLGPIIVAIVHAMRT
jgi:hypothetical protein